MRYQQLEDDDESDEVTGWKMIHGDVFRAPDHLPLLSICVGAGAQMLCMTTVTLSFALLGFLSPANRGGLLSAMLTLWVFASSINGYASARLYGSYDSVGRQRKIVTMGSALLFPGMCFSLFFMLNIAVWFSGSSGYVSFFTLVLLFLMWFGVSVPLVFTGAFIGYKRKQPGFPVRTNQIPRQIPIPPFNMPQWLYVLLAGILPFGCVFLQTSVFLSSVAHNQFLYIFGLMSVVFAILVVTCAEMSIVFTFLTLSSENHKWAWMAFCSSASSGLYLFLYTQFYLVTQPAFGTVSLVSNLLFSTYSLMVSVSFALMCGSVGWFSSSIFVRKIYSVIRCD
jgi:transmembrane 9 superfamily member 2/4